MTRTTRRAVAVVVALLTALAVLGVNPAPASAAACTWSACNGRDPHSTRCDRDATTLDDFEEPRAGYMVIRLRYSPSCNAVWALATVAASGMPGSLHWLVLRAYGSSTGGGPHTSYWKKTTNSTNDLPPSGTNIWTPMHTYASWTEACLMTAYEEGNCTTPRH